MKANLSVNKKSRITAVLLFLAGMIFGTLSFAQTPNAVIGRTSVTPVIDGVVDQVWANAQANAIARPFRTETPTLGALGETFWKGLCTLKGIYILVNVTDNVFSPPYAGTDPLTNWMYDKPELYFDCNYVKKDGIGPASGQGHYCFAPPPVKDQGSSLPIQFNQNGSAFCYKVSDSSYVAEYFIPFADLKDKDGVEVDKTEPIGFDITIVDNDVKTPVRNRLSWANTGTVDENWNNMDGAGLIALGTDPSNPITPIEKITLTPDFITTNRGTLQMVPVLEPQWADKEKIRWSVINGTGQATISETGLVTALSNGTVTIKAASKEEPFAEATTTVTISGQTGDYANPGSSYNLIRNWDFSSGLDNWGYWVDVGVNYQTLPVIVEGYVSMTAGQADNGEFWHYQLNQSGFQAEANVPYILKFKSWSNISKLNRVVFEDIPDNFYNRYGASDDASAINGRSEWEYETTTTPTWYTFHVTFDQLKANTLQKIQWMLSNVNATTYLDSILLIKESDINNPYFLTVSTSQVTLDTWMETNGQFDILSNTQWQISSQQTWLTITPLTGTSNQHISFTAKDNALYTNREAFITVYAEGITPKTIRIIQPGQSLTSKKLTVTAGGLSALLTANELAATTGLTLSGTLDARDFKTMRDQMPLLKELDLSGVTIASYSGTGGTGGFGVTSYPANCLPDNSFRTPLGLGKSSLKVIKLPTSLSAIGEEAFTYCTGITSITIPAPVSTIKSHAFSSCTALTTVILPASNSVASIGAYAFQNCTSLTSLDIPYQVYSIGEFAFNHCSAVINVNNANTLYSSLEGVLYNKNKTKLISCPTSKTGKFIIPSTVTSIETGAFSFCLGLTSLTFPSSLTSISHYAFSQCSALDTIYALSPVPVNLSSSTAVFEGVNEPPALLFVPFGSKALYAAAGQWKDFTIIEINGFSLSSHVLTLDAAAGSQSTVQLYCDTTWTASSSQSWLTVSPSQGLGSGILTFTAQANPLSAARTAEVTVAAYGMEAQTITITQQGQPLSSKTLTVTAGELLSLMTADELASTTRLTLTGTIDARDVKIMRDQMPKLEVVDISAVSIAEYTGTGGTCGYNTYTYPANVLPDNSFRTPSGLGKSTLKAVNLPLSIISIGKEAFVFCYGLTSLVVPEGVTSIRNAAFSSCKSLTSITLPSTLTLIEGSVFQNCYSLRAVNIPSSVTSIGEFAFNYCNAVITVEEANTKYSSQDGILFNKAKTSLISCPTSKTGGYTIPSSVTSIGNSAFSFCNNLMSITIPSSVTSISHYAFSQCKNIRAVNVSSPKPVNLSSSTAVFFGIDQATTILCVPFGSKALYAAANQWKDFNTIIEITGLSLSSNALELDAAGEGESTVQLYCDTTWTANPDQLWLSVSPSQGIGNSTLTISAQANPLYAARQAIVTVNSPGKNPQTITVTQKQNMQEPTMPGEATYGENWNDEVWNKYNLIKNWNFNADLSQYWGGWVDSWVTGQIAPVIVDGVVKLAAGQSTDGQFWHYLFNQSGFQAEANVPYILKFKSWSDIPKWNVVDFEDSEQNMYNRYGASPDPEANLGRSEWLYATTTEPRWYTFHVVFDQMVPTTVQKIQWMLSNTRAITYLDSIILVRGDDSSVVNTDYLELSAPKVTLEETEDTASVSIASNTDWEIQSDQSWLTAYPSTGSGNMSILITARPNPLYVNRTAVVTVYALNLAPKTIHFVQKAKPGDPVDPNDSIVEHWNSEAWNHYNLIKNWNFTTDLTYWNYWLDAGIAGDQDPKIASNGTVSMVTAATTDGYGWHYTFMQRGLKAEANVPYTLKFKSWSNKAKSNGLLFEDSPSNYWKRYGASADPESINGRAEWVYDTSTEPKWYTFHVVFDQMVPSTEQKIQWNLSTANATTYLDSVILIKDADLLRIKEAKLALSSSHLDVGATQTNIKVDVSSNTNSLAISDQKWLKVSPSIVTGNETLKILTEANPTDSCRTATITLYPAGLKSKTITVVQSTTTATKAIAENGKWSIYPNPTSGKAKLVFDRMPDRGTYLMVLDVTGRTVLKQAVQNGEEWIDLKGNPPGVYLVKTTMTDGKVQRIVLK